MANETHIIHIMAYESWFGENNKIKWQTTLEFRHIHRIHGVMHRDTHGYMGIHGISLHRVSVGVHGVYRIHSVSH